MEVRLRVMSRAALGGLWLVFALSACQSAPDAPGLAQPSGELQRPGLSVLPGASRPNIIVFVADDLGYADVSTYRPGRIPTPHIDRIGREGVVFAQGYATAPICSPARAGLMTGRHQQRFGFEYNTGAPARDLAERRGIDPRELTLADTMRAAGYRTGALGKWHLGSSPEFYPLNRGFDEFWGFLGGQTNFIRPDAPEAVNAFQPSAAPFYVDLKRPMASVSAANSVVTGSRRERVELGDGFLTEQITEQALAYIDRHRAQPFFLYVAHHAPHTPLQVTSKYYDRFPAIADRAQRVYAGMVSALDDGVGAVLDRLDTLGLAENTIVILVSDNGCAAYLPGLCSDQPLSGGKLSYLEGGVRIPYLMRWPAHIRSGTRHPEPVSTLDILPTLAAAAGVALPRDRAFDGVDLLPQLERVAQPRSPLFWRTRPMRALREGDWKYLRDLEGVEFVYHLAADPRETRNLAAADPSRLARMRSLYEAWESDKVAPNWPPARSVSYRFGDRGFMFPP